MPSGPKKRRAARRKQAKSQLVSSTEDEVSNDAVQNVVDVEDDVSKALMEAEIMELLIGNMPKENDVSVVSEVEVFDTSLSQNENGNGEIQLGSDEKDVEDDEVSMNGKFVELLELVEQIQDLVQGVRGLIVEQKDLLV